MTTSGFTSGGAGQVGKQATTKHMDGGILKLVKLRWEPTLQPRMNTKGNR